MSHLKNANKQASEPSVTFHDGSYALLFFSKIFYLEADERNAVTKTWFSVLYLVSIVEQ